MARALAYDLAKQTYRLWATHHARRRRAFLL